jgi:hypothetical protein
MLYLHFVMKFVEMEKDILSNVTMETISMEMAVQWIAILKLDIHAMEDPPTAKIRAPQFYQKLFL